MKAVFSAAQLGHAPTRFLSLGKIVDYPDSPERARHVERPGELSTGPLHQRWNVGNLLGG